MLRVAMKAVDFATMLQAPIGRYAHQGPFMAWACTPTLCGITYLGRIGDEHLEMLRSAAVLPFHDDLRPPYRAIVDLSRMLDIGPGVFGFLLEHIRDMRDRNQVERLAVLRPAGLAGAASIGLVHEYLEGHIEVSFCADPTEALTYLETTEREAAAIAKMLDEALVAPALIDRLRTLLADTPGLDIAAAAQQLGMTRRAFQRALQRARTSFRAEVVTGRFAHALKILTGSNDKIEVVARRAGYASALNFARRVRQVYNMTPSELRKALRG
jgi:AraC-like DNA-binding protein